MTLGSVVGTGVTGTVVAGGCVAGGSVTDVPVVLVGVAAGVGAVVGTNAVSGVGPPALAGPDGSPEIPRLSATVARIRLMTPSASTSRRRCAAVTSAQASRVLGGAGHGGPSSPRWYTGCQSTVLGGPF
jgi:hypothetical protein